MDDLPLLPVMGVGSYAAPGWFIAFRDQIREGNAGENDIREAIDDAIRIAVLDQLETGIDIVTDGELRRQRFVYEMFDHIEGIKRIPPKRRIGVPGYDMAPHFEVLDRIHSPTGFNFTEDFNLLNSLAPNQHLKVTIPGPLTFAMPLEAGTRHQDDIFGEIIEMIQQEISALAEAGCQYLQIDEPALSHPPFGIDFADAADLINRSTENFHGKVAVHVCFGNNAGRPFANRNFSRIMETMKILTCDQLVLEFANRQMAEIELLEPLSHRFEIAAGIIDVKNFYLETPEEIVKRIQCCLQYVPIEKLTITSDCGFSALPRYLAKQKMQAMVMGAMLARDSL